MSGITDPKRLKHFEEQGFRPVAPSDAKPNVKVTIDGMDADDEALAKLLEDTARFIRAAQGTCGAEAGTQKEVTFERIELGDIVSSAHRS